MASMVLPKAYGVIERFSENIDLVLDWSNLTKKSDGSA
jgi:hypothetical protein